MIFSSPLQAIKRDIQQRRERIAHTVNAAKNDAARAARAALYSEQRAVFDRPTPYVVPAGNAEGVGSVRVVYAGHSSPDAVVMIRGPGQVPGGAIPQQSALRAEIRGGGRHLKRLEVALQRAGVMPAGWYAVPAGAGVGRNGGGGGARLDAYGNMSRGQVVQIIAYFNAFGAGNKRSNMTDKTRARLARDKKRRGSGPFVAVAGRGFIDKAREAQAGVSYFAVKEKHGGLSPGIWQRQRFGFGQAVRPVLFFVRSVAYPVRLKFAQVTDTAARAQFARSLKSRGSLP